MKIIHTFFSLVVTILTVSCYGHGHPALPLAVSQPEAAEESQFKVSLDLLEKEPENRNHWEQFFEERGARVFWRTLLVSEESNYQFDLDKLQKEGVANEVVAGIARYLAYYQKDEVNKLCILGTSSAENKGLTSLDPAIGQLTNLQELWLSNNQLQALPTEIGQLANLKELWIGYSQLQALPTAIGQLTNLQELWLSNNQLQALPEEIGQLTDLEKLYLNNNQLQALPTAIGQLTNLKKLWIDNNQLQALPEEIGQLTNLKKLWIGKNQLACLSEKLLLWYQQVGNRISTDENPWLKPDDLSKVSREKLEKIAETPLDAFHDTIRGMAEAAMRTEKFRVNLVEVEDQVKVTLKKRGFHRLTVFTLLPHLLRKGQLNRDRRIIFFEGEIPFYVDRELCSQQDVNNMLQDLEGKQLYRCLPGSPRSSSKEQPARKRRRYS